MFGGVIYDVSWFSTVFFCVSSINNGRRNVNCSITGQLIQILRDVFENKQCSFLIA